VLSIVALNELGACSSVQPPEVHTTQLELQTPVQTQWPSPAPVKMRKVVWTAGADGTLALDARNYANLSYNTSELLRYVEQQQAVVQCYRDGCK
jgi:hypothetical protein